MDFIKRKGGTVFLYNGHQYYKLKCYKEGSEIWRCSNYKKEKCTGTVKIKVTYFDLLLNKATNGRILPCFKICRLQKLYKITMLT